MKAIMKDSDMKRIFEILAAHPMSEEKKREICTAVLMRRVSALKRRLILLAGTAALSMASIIMSAYYAWKSMVSSGVFSYVSLAFSDTGTLLTYWKEFAFTLLESLPMLSAAAFLGAVALFIWSGTRVIRDSKVHFVGMSVVS